MSSVAVAPRKKHRGRNALIAFVIVVVLLVAAFFVADYFAKKYATSYVQQQVATALDLPSTAPVHVDLGSGSILLQAVTGSINNVTVDVDPLVIDGLSGSAVLTAHGVPLSSTAPVKSLQVDVTVPETTITQAIKKVPELASFSPTVSVAGNDVTVAGSFSVFGFVQHLSVTMTPKVSAGAPSFTITTAKFNGATISVIQLDKDIPGLATVLQSGTSLCIADALPKSFVLTGVSIQGQSLVSTFTGDGVELNGAALAQRGTCQ
ncbi:MAG TPA: DUF2993 domain-containing protein [Galbitalea sp.]|jgi:hypothetical protein|nr:DUF2993 domain-containing protein [Galbitalea sp.]